MSQFDILDHVPLGMCVLRRDYEILFWNRCLEDWSGVPRQRAVGANIVALFPSSFARKYTRRLQHIFEGGPPVVFSAPLHKYMIPCPLPSGQLRIQHTTVTAVRGEREAEYYALVAMQDVSDFTHVLHNHSKIHDQALQELNQRRQTEEVLRQNEARYRLLAERLQDDYTEMEAFSYTVSHDLRAPLRAIRGFTQALAEDYGNMFNDTATDYVRRIADSAARMDGMLKDLLSYSQLRGQALSLEPIPLDTVFAEAQSQMEISLREYNAEICVLGDLPVVLSDWNTTMQIVTNLLTNAIKFVAPEVKPKIKIWAQHWDGQVRIWVEDNGIGIEPAYQMRIFRIFERVHETKDYPGTGVGLAIVHQAVTRLGGRIGLESTPGVGSKFWFQLVEVSRQHAAS